MLKMGLETMQRVYNFNAGPAMLPEEVLTEAQKELLDWNKTGMSIMEISHRSSNFKQIMEQTEADFRELMGIPKHYHVLFLAGGATTQFAMVPLNLFGAKTEADYIETGIWSKKAITEASRYGKVNIAAHTEFKDKLAYIPEQSTWKLNPNAAYVHYTPNETIDGLEFHWVPQTQNVPLVADMTSMILSRPIDVNEFGIIYAGAQKNIGPAGLTIAIVREDLIQTPLPHTPTLYSYKIQTENQSIYNTPPTFCWYMAGLVFSWMKRKGGVLAFYEINKRKANKLYDVIDANKDFYQCRVSADSRSMTNIMFYLQDDKLEPIFLAEAEKIGLVNLRGHRVSGGIRASIYNAMPEKACDILANFMKEFVKKHG